MLFPAIQKSFSSNEKSPLPYSAMFPAIPNKTAITTERINTHGSFTRCVSFIMTPSAAASPMSLTAQDMASSSASPSDLYSSVLSSRWPYSSLLIRLAAGLY